MTSSLPNLLVHWFYRKKESSDDDWKPFTKYDSGKLEHVYQEHQSNSSKFSGDNVDNQINISTNDLDDDSLNDIIVSTNGGRYDVYLNQRLRRAVYWQEQNNHVLRATWFYRPGGRLNYKPFNEDSASLIEQCYLESVESGNWNHKIVLPTGDMVIFYNAKVIMHYEADYPFSDDWSSITDNLTKPGRVWRGIQDLAIEEGEPEKIDHLVFVVHGIGEICDLKMRNLVEVVDDFRSLANNLIKSHLVEEADSPNKLPKIGRVEFLPISWHAALHGGKTGIDDRLKLITLNSIPKLRHFSNDTILDALFYTSPIYCQMIIDTVGSELDRVYKLFTRRNPNFQGTLNLMGHSLGALIIFDILSHQDEAQNSSCQSSSPSSSFNDKMYHFNSVEDVLQLLNLSEYVDKFKAEKIDYDALLHLSEDNLVYLGLQLGPRLKLLKFIEKLRFQDNQLLAKENTVLSRSKLQCFNYGNLEAGQPCIKYPQLTFEPSCFFALGSPVSAFLIVRGVTSLTKDYQLPTCHRLYNIFHPFDPIAYRLEPLIDDKFYSIQPCQIAHHKGRKRMHLELRESLVKMGTDLKEKVLNSFKPVWDSLNGFKRAKGLMLRDYPPSPASPTSPTINFQSEIENSSTSSTAAENHPVESNETGERFEDSEMAVSESEPEPSSRLNTTGRVDYVLQEAPIEFFNEYIFALATHACYWQSEDTALFVLREIYKLPI